MQLSLEYHNKQVFIAENLTLLKCTAHVFQVAQILKKLSFNMKLPSDDNFFLVNLSSILILCIWAPFAILTKYTS